MWILRLTFERAGNVGLPDVVVSDRERLAGGRGICNLSSREDAEEVRNNGHRATTGEIGCCKYATQLLVLLRVEILAERGKSSTREILYKLL